MTDDPHASYLVHDFSAALQFRRAMASTGPDDWFTDEVWRNPWSNNHAVLIFVKAVRSRPGAPPDGVLYLEFDWEALMTEVIGHAGDRTGELSRLRISILDPSARLVGSSWGGGFGERMALPPGDRSGLEIRADSVAAFATARPIGGFDALGLRCLIEQPVAQEDEIAGAIAPRRAA